MCSTTIAVTKEQNDALSGFSYNNNSVNYNTSKITNNGWHLNFKGAANQSKTDSAIAKGHESDGTKNYQVNLNGSKWLNDNLGFVRFNFNIRHQNLRLLAHHHHHPLEVQLRVSSFLLPSYFYVFLLTMIGNGLR